MNKKDKVLEVAKATDPNAVIAAGVDVIVSFRYFEGKKDPTKTWCAVTFGKGKHGIVGTSTVYPFLAMMSLKGSGTAVCWEQYANKEDGHERFSIEWSLY